MIGNGRPSEFVTSNRAVVRPRRLSIDSLVTPNVIWAIVLTASASILSIPLAVAWYVSLAKTIALWAVIVLMNVLAAWTLRKKFGSSTPKRYLLPFFVAVLISFYLFAARAPHRPQQCVAKVAYSAWDAFCTQPDSASYYFGYFPASSRQPLYPWFIKLVTSGFNAQQWARRHPAGVAISDPTDPLLRVERAQILFLLGSASLTCLWMMYLLNSPLPGILFVSLYYGVFMVPHELNQIMTETLVQAWLFLLVSAFLAFVWKPRKQLLPVAGALCGALYLTRQASGYAVIFMVAMIIWGMIRNRRAYWLASALSLMAFACLAVIPDAYGYVKLGNVSSAQNNLQYQYRIAYALQFAQPQDARLMPDEYSRHWLVEKINMRQSAHNKVREMCQGDPYCQQVYYINTNLYNLATPPGFDPPNRAQFYMNIATPILKRHPVDYFLFAFRSWTLAITNGVSKIRIPGITPWFVYALCLVGIVWSRGQVGFSAGFLILGHLFHVALSCLFAAPIGRMIRASEFLVVIAVFLLLWEAFERISAGLMTMPKAD